MASCLQCKFLFTRDTGYSNYTVEDTDLHCVLKLNPKLPAEIPDEVRDYYASNEAGYTWMKADNDKWHATKDGRCDKYVHTDNDPPHIDCEGESIMPIKNAEDHFFKTGDGMQLRISKYFDADYEDAGWVKP
jgi:hypothetical protein